jgi:hypothetical protein
MFRLVERQLITRTPHKNHASERDAEHTKKGVQPLGFRDPGFRHAIHGCSLRFYGIAPSVLIGGRRYWLLLLWQRQAHLAASN